MNNYSRNGKDPITKDGMKALQKELKHREGSKAKSLADSLENTWDQGDERENDGFTIAFEQFNDNLQRIRIIKKIIKETYIYEPVQHAKVDIGHLVTLKTDNTVVEYKIVGKYESDVLNNKLSNESPLAIILIGKKNKSKFQFNNKEFQILDIK